MLDKITLMKQQKNEKITGNIIADLFPDLLHNLVSMYRRCSISWNDFLNAYRRFDNGCSDFLCAYRRFSISQNNFLGACRRCANLQNDFFLSLLPL